MPIGFHFAEEFVIFDFTVRHYCGIECRRRVAGFDLEIEALAVHIITRRNFILGDQRIALHAGDQCKRLFGRQQFFFLGL